MLALELILRRHDRNKNKGVSFGDIKISTLGYADDAALTDSDISVAKQRVNAIAAGSKKDADMTINTDKTEIMHVREQDRVPKITAAQVKAVCTVAYTHVGCDRVFYNVHGMRCHAGRCKWVG